MRGTSPTPARFPLFDTYTAPSGPTSTPVGFAGADEMVVRAPLGATRMSSPGPPKNVGLRRGASMALSRNRSERARHRLLAER
jgi:hypothetical protein